MNDKKWQLFFTTAIDVLGEGDYRLSYTPSWVSWTTFTRLVTDAGYWTTGLPRKNEILGTYIADGGIWGQPFLYSDLAHLIIPNKFYWEAPPGPEFVCGYKEQNISLLSAELNKSDVAHRLTDKVLEIKLY